MNLVQQRLVAIPAADIVGYSRMMADDQNQTLVALRSIRSELFGELVTDHHGTVIKSMGDGWLVEFGSAVDTVKCGMAIQDRLVAHETIKIRIGIHIGDVTHKDEDIFGDGVNVAARLEAITAPEASPSLTPCGPQPRWDICTFFRRRRPSGA
ncbi:MAG: adenylate cyclase [bacterium]